MAASDDTGMSKRVMWI